ncbi:MAG: hypothetical protein GXZ11_01430 [Tissierellia bacterium]|nr:hypothetical protein [Tissierellia bacterium]
MERLNKATKGGLVKVAVQVNGRFGTYQSHRWKNPNTAFDILKKDFKKQGIKDVENLEYVDKNSNKSKSEEEVIKDYEAFKGDVTLQDFVKNGYTLKLKTARSAIKTPPPAKETSTVIEAGVVEETGDDSLPNLTTREFKEGGEYLNYRNEIKAEVKEERKALKGKSLDEAINDGEVRAIYHKFPTSKMDRYDEVREVVRVDRYNHMGKERNLIFYSYRGYDGGIIRSSEDLSEKEFKNRVMTVKESEYKLASYAAKRRKEIYEDYQGQLTAALNSPAEVSVYEISKIIAVMDAMTSGTEARGKNIDAHIHDFNPRDIDADNKHDDIAKKLLDKKYENILKDKDVEKILTEPFKISGPLEGVYNNYKKKVAEREGTRDSYVEKAKREIEKIDKSLIQREELYKDWQNLLNKELKDPDNAYWGDISRMIWVMDYLQSGQYFDRQDLNQDASILNTDLLLNGFIPSTEMNNRIAKALIEKATERQKDISDEDKERSRLASIRKQKQSIKKDKVIPFENKHTPIDNLNDFKTAISNVANLPREQRDRAIMDMAGMNVDLFYGYSQKAAGIARYYVDVKSGQAVLDSIGLLNVDKSPDYSQRKTLIHEIFHGLITQSQAEHKLGKHPSSKYTVVEEAVVESVAMHFAEQEGHSIKNGDTIPSYANYITRVLPVLKSNMPEFSNCKSIGEFGSILAEGIYKRDKGFIDNVMNSFVKQSKGFDVAQWAKNAGYVSDNAEAMSRKLDQYGDKVSNAIAQSNGVEGDIPGMATFISALKAGSITITSALNGGAYSDLAFILLACIMEEEGIEDIEGL